MKARGLLAVLAILLLALGWQAALLQAEQASDRSTRGGSGASEKPSDADVASKLEQVLEGQERILKRLDEVMEELRIVKIRASVKR